MEVKAVNGLKVESKEVPQKEVLDEVAFYLSDNMAQDLYLYNLISLDEYHQIKKRLVKKYRPLFYQIMN